MRSPFSALFGEQCRISRKRLVRNRQLLFAMTAALAAAPMQAQNLSFVSGEHVRLEDSTIPHVADAGVLTTHVVDLRGNGQPDLVVGMGVFPPIARTKVPMRIARVGTDGKLQDVTRQLLGPGSLPSLEHPREIVGGDFSRDGRLDLFVAGHGYDTMPFDGEVNVLLHSSADGSLLDRSTLLPSAPDFSHSTAVGDIDGDGNLDIYVGQIWGTPQIPPYFLMGRPDGSFFQRNDNLPLTIRSLSRKFVSSLLMDVNGDGATDLVLGTDHDNGNSDSVVLVNDGAGDFTRRLEIALPRSVFGANQLVMDLVPFDVNGDAAPDLLVVGTQAQPFYQGHFLQLLINNGDGSFRDETASRLLGETSRTSGDWFMFVRPGDLNGDGVMDFHVVANLWQEGRADFVWINDGQGRFRAISSTALAETLMAMEALDLDGDGRLDLLEVSGDGTGGLQYRPYFNRLPAISLSNQDRYLWLATRASNDRQQAFLRLTNRENRSGAVTLRALDATGRLSKGSITLTLAPYESRQMNAQDLESGNAGKGLTGDLGWGSGDWTVMVSSALDLDAQAYIRTPDGFLTSMHDRVAGNAGDWQVPMFNPAENLNQLSRLRLVNPNATPTTVQIGGIDDAGKPGSQVVNLTLREYAAAELTSVDLEQGNAGKGLSGKLGDGAGKWRLTVSASNRLTVQSLLFDPKGYLTNLSLAPVAGTGEHTLWLVPPASNTQQQGFIRLVNRSGTAGTVTLYGIDDTGTRSNGTITFSLAAHESKQMNSQDLEFGNAGKGLSGSLGAGSGNWRLVIDSTLDLWPMAFIRTPDGFLTSMHDRVPGDGLTHRVAMFNPAENPNQKSSLRIVNPSAGAATITISGLDDAGKAGSNGTVSFTLAAGAAIEVSAADLESGNAAKGLGGSLGDGAGKWTLTVNASTPVQVMNLLADPRGYLTNLSTNPRGTSDRLDP